MYILCNTIKVKCSIVLEILHQEESLFIMRKASSKISSILILNVVMMLFIISASALAQMSSLLYNPGDSTLYISVETEYSNQYIYRFGNGGSRIERSRAIDDLSLRLQLHDNLPGRLYGFFNRPYRIMVSENAGDDWSTIDVPFLGGISSAGENPGEGFAEGSYQIDDEWIGALFSTTDSWESWDTSYVCDNWESHDYRISFGLNNGHMWRVPYRGRYLSEFHFSSDTGRTWTAYELEEPLDNKWIWPSVDAEFYLKVGWDVKCIQNFGEQVFSVIDLLNYGRYDEEGDPSWAPGVVIPTNRAGEFYVVMDSLFWYIPGIKFDIFHVTGYGEEVNQYSYYLDDYKVSVDQEPTIAFPLNIEIRAYPNPSNSGFVITVHGLRSDGAISIYDIVGRIIYTAEVKPCVSPLYIKWDGKSTYGFSIPSGKYILSLKSDSRSVQQSITVIR